MIDINAMKENLGREVRMRMAADKVTIGQLAHFCQMSPSMAGDCRNGKTFPNLSIARHPSMVNVCSVWEKPSKSSEIAIRVISSKAGKTTKVVESKWKSANFMGLKLL